jgi:hypothetical protein
LRKDVQRAEAKESDETNQKQWGSQTGASPLRSSKTYADKLRIESTSHKEMGIIKVQKEIGEYEICLPKKTTDKKRAGHRPEEDFMK